MKDKNKHKIAHLVIVGFKIMSILLKVVAHVVGGMGNLVPNFAHGLALVYDAQDIINCIEDPKIHARPIVGQSSTSHFAYCKRCIGWKTQGCYTMACGLLEKERHIQIVWFE